MKLFGFSNLSKMSVVFLKKPEQIGSDIGNPEWPCTEKCWGAKYISPYIKKYRRPQFEFALFPPWPNSGLYHRNRSSLILVAIRLGLFFTSHNVSTPKYFLTVVVCNNYYNPTSINNMSSLTPAERNAEATSAAMWEGSVNGVLTLIPSTAAVYLAMKNSPRFLARTNMQSRTALAIMPALFVFAFTAVSSFCQARMGLNEWHIP